jgi:hypothetical protein
MEATLPQQCSAPRTARRRIALLVGNERIRRRKPQRNTETDDEGRVDERQQQEDLSLQHVHELRLTRRGLDVLGCHEAHANTGTEGADTNDQTAGESDEADIRHDDFSGSELNK